MILYYDFKDKSFKIKALSNLYVNETLLTENSESLRINTEDKIGIECDVCCASHAYIIFFPKIIDEATINYSTFANFNDMNSHANNYEENAKLLFNKNSYANNSNTLMPANGNIFNDLQYTNKIPASNIGQLQSAISLPARHPDIALGNKWTNHEKECLRKYILIFGYGRWKIIKHNSRGVLSEKPEIELKIFSNAFLKVIIEFLPQEKMELRKFLINLIQELPDEPFILAKKDDWGTLLKQRAPAWGKRIQLIYRVCLIIEKFKSERKKNKEIRKKIDIQLRLKTPIRPDEAEDEEAINNININNIIPIKNEENTNSNSEENKNSYQEVEKLKTEINKTFDYWDNLLNFLPNHAFYGQRPSIWWTRTHDIDLLRGTYKHGYANYQIMRSDPKLSFSKLEKDTNFQEFPSADTITRRLKKLIQIIIKSESSNGIISFEDKKSLKEPTGFNLEEKNSIINFLADFGVPLNSEGKSDWVQLKDILTRAINLDASKTPQMIERLVQRLRMISQLVIQLYSNGNAKYFIYSIFSIHIKNPSYSLYLYFVYFLFFIIL